MREADNHAALIVGAVELLPSGFPANADLMPTEWTSMDSSATHKKTPTSDVQWQTRLVSNEMEGGKWHNF